MWSFSIKREHPACFFFHIFSSFSPVPSLSPSHSSHILSFTFSAFLVALCGRQLYEWNLTPLLSHLTLNALWENITCRASGWATDQFVLVWLSRWSWRKMAIRNGKSVMWTCWCIFSVKGSEMAAEWSAFIKLVSVRGRIFLVPLSLGMLPICWPQPQTCVQLSHFQASFHLTHTHTYRCRAWIVWTVQSQTTKPNLRSRHISPPSSSLSICWYD